MFFLSLNQQFYKKNSQRATHLTESIISLKWKYRRRELSDLVRHLTNDDSMHLHEAKMPSPTLFNFKQSVVSIHTSWLVGDFNGEQSSGKSVECEMCVNNRCEIAFFFSLFQSQTNLFALHSIVIRIYCCTNGHRIWKASVLYEWGSERRREEKKKTLMTLFNSITQVENDCNVKSTNGFNGNIFFSFSRASSSWERE